MLHLAPPGPGRAPRRPMLLVTLAGTGTAYYADHEAAEGRALAASH
jgi:hypothetical protein